MRGVERPAAGQRHDDVEELERADHREEDRQPDHRAKQGQGDVPEPLVRLGAVHLRRVQHLPVDALEASDVKHHMEAEIFPEDHDQHGAKGPVRAPEQVKRLEPEEVVTMAGRPICPSSMKRQIRPAATSARM